MPCEKASVITQYQSNKISQMEAKLVHSRVHTLTYCKISISLQEINIDQHWIGKIFHIMLNWPHFTHFISLCFWGKCLLRTHEVYQQFIITSLLAVPSDYTMNGLITCNLIRIIPGILGSKSNQKLYILLIFHIR